MLKASPVLDEPTLPDLALAHGYREQTSVPDHLKVIDLFCGAGGLATGFALAGYESVLGVDVWDWATDTFRLHHQTATTLTGDISAISDERLLECAGVEPGKLGVICGGPPCQGFSLAGRSISDDPRNFLYRHFLRAVALFRPRWVVMENVPALLKHPSVASSIHTDFKRIGVETDEQYDVQHIVVNAAYFGVPQTRQRVFFIARRKDVGSSFDLAAWMQPRYAQKQTLFNEPTFITVEQAIYDLPFVVAGGGEEIMAYDKAAATPYQALMRGDLSISEYHRDLGIKTHSFFKNFQKSNAVYNHVAQQHSDLLVERFSNIPPGGDKEDLRRTRPDLLPPEGHPDQGLTYGRLWEDRPAPTIPANYSRPSGNRSIHPSIPRLITPREAMRLSSFPDFYLLSGGKVAQREQVGNSVPPLLSFQVASNIRLCEGA